MGFSVSWFGQGWGEATGPQPPFLGLTLGPPGPGPAPCSLLEHRGRVAGFQLHVPTWAVCQGAGPGLGMGPARETGQLGKSGGSRGGTGEGTEATGQRRDRAGTLGVDMPSEAWHLSAQALKSWSDPAHPSAFGMCGLGPLTASLSLSDISWKMGGGWVGIIPPLPCTTSK